MDDWAEIPQGSIQAEPGDHGDIPRAEGVAQHDGRSRTYGTGQERVMERTQSLVAGHSSDKANLA